MNEINYRTANSVPFTSVQFSVRFTNVRALFDTNGAIALTSFLFHFPLFNDVLLPWVSCSILRDHMWGN